MGMTNISSESFQTALFYGRQLLSKNYGGHQLTLTVIINNFSNEAARKHVAARGGVVFYQGPKSWGCMTLGALGPLEPQDMKQNETNVYWLLLDNLITPYSGLVSHWFPLF